MEPALTFNDEDEVSASPVEAERLVAIPFGERGGKEVGTFFPP